MSKGEEPMDNHTRQKDEEIIIEFVELMLGFDPDPDVAEAVKRMRERHSDKKQESDAGVFFICDHADDGCPEGCNHAIPHDQIYDDYDDVIGYCTDVRSVCFWRDDRPNCMCVQGNKNEL